LSEEPAQIREAIQILKRIAEDPGVPRNIRRACSESIEMLLDQKMSVGLRAANAISRLDEISMDPNAPQYARTAIWHAIALLEQIRD